MCRAYWGVDGDSQQLFGLIVKRFGQDHLSTVGKLNLEILCIRLPNTRTHRCKWLCVCVASVIWTETGTHWCLINGVNDLIVICVCGLNAEDNSAHRSQLETQSKKHPISIQFSFIYKASVTISTVSTETQSPTPEQTIAVGKSRF